MSNKTRAELEQIFINGAKPTEDDFHDWMDSYVHKDDPIDTAPTSGSNYYIQNQYDAPQAADFKVNQGNVNTFSAHWTGGVRLNYNGYAFYCSTGGNLGGVLYADAANVGCIVNLSTDYSYGDIYQGNLTGMRNGETHSNAVFAANMTATQSDVPYYNGYYGLKVIGNVVNQRAYGVYVDMQASDSSANLYAILVNNGKVVLKNLPVYDDNTQASSLEADQMYRTSNGDLKIKY
ncbi:hypothetical protein [Taibaiella soli]|uniref:Uncharacterized protein n=1 Tax=Taibaiella soli TaxID=1649169 RepID=A0A2W2AEL1_9BACT|nr:hypothetical protein [Taibaiella soli]PZF73905.1 hypothetical protein DN068_06065 [Taibaiella soli]